MLNLVHADDNLPDDEEIAPLGDIEQVKGEIDQRPFGEIEQVKGEVDQRPFCTEIEKHICTTS